MTKNSFKLGDKVKVTRKDSTYNHRFSSPGVVVRVETIEDLETTVVMYIQTNFDDPTIEFLYYNSKTEDYTITQTDETFLLIEEAETLNQLNRKIDKAIQLAANMASQRDFFMQYFNEQTIIKKAAA